MGLKDDMLAMGFGENRTARALKAVRYESMERAIAWLECHENDPDIDDPVAEDAGHVLGSTKDDLPPSQLEEVAVPELTEEERAAKQAAVQARLAEKRRQVEEKDKRDAILKEKIRRKEGQSLAEIREKQQQEDMRKLAEERRRQKIEDERARKAVLEKIKRDREAKAAEKNSAVQQEVSLPVQPAAVVAPPARNYEECRLQLRLPSGQALVNSFKAEDTLGDVVAFLRDKHAELESFSLMTSFPRKNYQTSEYTLSLRSLGLCPSSVLIVSKQ